ncbi:ubiquinone biosynthesis accessory factor UbiJ [Psychromonas sp. CD1]|uniref:ubiquinone biosynthesis accessory factor UbiJ n=1 Tax=Psychromonas sp. CD1 TaxID=1979839 RepID=UPI000B9A922A|nr:SCP2 sterol-binding domain-containing protein [Psychromonas sp. CD1]
MSLNDLFCAMLETSLNKLQQFDKSSKVQRKQLAENIIGITFKEFNQTLYFVISEQQIDVLNIYEGHVDCFIQLSVFALNDLKNNQKLTELIRNEQLDIVGDIQLAQQFAQLLTVIDIDWEALLADKIGDVLAHKFFYLINKGNKNIKNKFKNKKNNQLSLLLAEKNISPAPLEVAFFCDQVTEIEQQLLDLEARINRHRH